MASSALVTPPTVDVSILNRFPAGVVARTDREAALEFAALPAPSTAMNRYWRVDFARIDLGVTVARPLVTPTYTATADAVKAGVILSSLADAAKSHTDLVNRYLGSIIPASESRFTALASAMEQGGYFVYVPAGVKLETPLTVSVTVPNGSQWSPRCLILLEQGASIAIHEEFVSTSAVSDTTSLVCGTVEAIIAADAQLTVITQQNLDEQTNVFMTRRATVERNANVRWAVAELGGSIVQSRLEAKLNGEGANSDAAALLFPFAKQHIDLHTEVIHAVPNTTSKTMVKAAAMDHGQGRYEGNIKIVPGAHGTSAHLRDDSLLLSPDAHVDSIPALEIAANDVQAFHGATVGALDKEIRFYLMSRGITAEDADRMITLAFFDGALAHVHDAAIREQIVQRLSERVGKNDR